MVTKASAEEPRRVLLIEEAKVPCLDTRELVATLQRDGSVSARVGRASDASAGEVLVKVKLEPPGVRIELSENDAIQSEMLRPSSCTTTTEAVAAFVVSALSPAPAVGFHRRPRPYRPHPRSCRARLHRARRPGRTPSSCSGERHWRRFFAAAPRAPYRRMFSEGCPSWREGSALSSASASRPKNILQGARLPRE